MNCKYILQNNIHEKYIQNELSKSEIEIYKGHLEFCSTCSEDLKQERMLLEGIKSAAKETMKAEIAQQAENLRPLKKQIDWTVIYKAAAVFLLVAFLPGIVYYYNNIEAPHESVSGKMYAPVSLPGSDKVLQDIKTDSTIEKMETRELVKETEKISDSESASKLIRNTMPTKSEAKPKSTPAKQIAPAPLKPVAAKAGNSSRLKTDELDVFESKFVESPPTKSKKMHVTLLEEENEALADPLKALRNIASDEEQSRPRRSFFIPAIRFNQSKSGSKSAQSLDYFQSTSGNVRIRAEFRESSYNRLLYTINHRENDQLEMDWTFFVPGSFISISELEYELVQDSLMRLFRNDTLRYELNLNRSQDSASFRGNR